MAKAKPVFVRKEVFRESSLYTNLDSFIETLSALRTNPLARYEVETSVEHEYGSDYAQIAVFEIRPETEEERTARLKKERSEKISQAQRDLEEFDRLKKKLGK